MKKISLYDFAKKYVKIKDDQGKHSFNEKQLEQIKEMQTMMDKGYELNLIHFRKGSRMTWVKKQIKYENRNK